MAGGRDDTGFLEAARARKRKRTSENRKQSDADARQDQFWKARQEFSDAFHDAPHQFWGRSVDPIMKLGDLLREMDASRHLDNIILPPGNGPRQYALDILRCAVGNDPDGVVKLTTDLVGSDIGREDTDAVAFNLRDNVMELVARADWVAKFPDSPEKPIDRNLKREWPDREPEPVSDRVAELSARIQWWANQRGPDVDGAPGERTENEHEVIPFSEIRTWLAEPESITGKGRRIVEAVLDAGGTLPLKDLNVEAELDWPSPFDDAYKGQQRRIKSAPPAEPVV